MQMDRQTTSRRITRPNAWQSLALPVTILVILSAGIILSVWTARLDDKRMRDELSIRAGLVKGAIDVNIISSLSGSEADLDLPGYRHLKDQLISARLADPQCHFLYLMGMRSDGTVFFFADSEKEGSSDYSPPGQAYTEVSDAYRNVFFTGKATVTGPISDRWGSWMSALAPIVEPNTGKVYAVFGIDVEARSWMAIVFYHSILPIALFLCAAVIIVFLLRMRRRDKRIENILGIAKTRLELALQSSKMGVWQFNIVENKRIFDDQACLLLGIDPKKFSGAAEEFFAIVHPDDREKIKAALEKTIEQGIPYEPEYRAIWPDGSIHYISARGELLYDDKGDPHIVNGIIWDITERKRSEEALRISEEKFRLLIENSHDIIYRLTPDGVFTFVSPAWTVLLGHPISLVEGQPFQPFVHPDDLAACMAWLKKVIETGRRQEGVEYRVRHIDGSWRWHTSSAVPLRDETGAIVGFEGTARDITERKQREKALVEAEEKIRLLLDSTAEAIYGLDMNGNCTFCNNACLKMLGYKQPDELLGKNMHWQIHAKHSDGTPFPVEECRIFQAFQKGEGTHVDDEVLWRFDGTSFPAEYWSYPQRRGGAVVGAVVTFLNITERKKMENELASAYTGLEDKVMERTKELRDAQDKIVRSEKLATIGQVAASVAHEIRNPLGVIKNAAYYLNMTELCKNDPECKENLNIIFQEIKNSDKIINDLLEYSRTKESNLRPENINSIIEEMTGKLKAAPNVELALELGRDLPNIEVDAQQIKQVFYNITQNALESMEKGGKLKIKTGIKEDFIEVSFSDTGSGISKENLRKIFDPLFSTKAKGTGLGLSVCTVLVERHGGRIDVQSEEGRGATFTVKLPVRTKR